MTDYGLKRISPGSFDDNGRIIPFRKQLESFAFGKMPSGNMLVVAESLKAAGITEMIGNDAPLLMRQRTLRKIQAEHEISLEKLMDLPSWLKEHPLMLESITEKDSIVVVADAVDKAGNPIIVAIHLENTARGFLLNDAASVYGKRNLAYLIENTYDLNKRVYVNERTGGWIRRTGLPLPERIANRLHEDCTTSTARCENKTTRSSTQVEIRRRTPVFSPQSKSKTR